jgi:hypothetical protein
MTEATVSISSFRLDLQERTLDVAHDSALAAACAAAQVGAMVLTTFFEAVQQAAHGLENWTRAPMS